MNRFLNKKKAAGGNGASSERTSNPMSPPNAKDNKRWKKGKKTPESPKLDLNLMGSLPSDENFRTSLLMPNLSARFSMLREQDDPNSKVGKAMDDSVLSPTRQSRLLDFGFTSNGLSDIAEVASISGSVRPPWLATQHDSYGSEDGYGTDNDSSVNGSVMSRSRPGEGNVLFGGRQKVYKIPSSSLSATRSTSVASGLGKAIHEDDTNMSAFQKYKQQEREAEAVRQSEDLDMDRTDILAAATSARTVTLEDNQQTTETVSRPIQNFSHSRTPSSHQRQQSFASSSTTAPSQARSSTPATSIASQPAIPTPASSSPQPTKDAVPALPRLERSMTKRRLYEQGLDQHMYEQQASALTRLNSIQRQRTLNGGKAPPPGLLHAKSVGNMHDRSYQPYAVRPQSPPGLNPLTTFGSMRKPDSSASSPLPSHPQSPTSPPLNDYDDFGVLSSALQPADRGKATAMGAFDRPKNQFDEQQYLQRQLQLQQTRDAQSSPDPIDSLSHGDKRMNRFDSVRQEATSREYNRPRSQSSPAKPAQNNAFSDFQIPSAQNHIAQTESPKSSPVIPDTHRTFFGDISASDDEEEEDDVASGADRNGHGFASGYSNRFNPAALSSVSEHPALRSQGRNFAEIEEEEEEEEEEAVSSSQPLRPMPSIRSLDTEVTLAPDTYQGAQNSNLAPFGTSKEALGGLVHQHLRNTSNQSSIGTSVAADHTRSESNQSSLTGPTTAKETSVPSMTESTLRTTRNTYSSENRIDSSYTNSNPWDLDDFDSSYYYGDSNGSKNPSYAESVKQRGPLAISNSRGNIARDSDIVDGTAWQSDLKPNHTRDASTATLQEREAFANELATRQKAIQENLRSIAEGQSRSASPQPSTVGAVKAFGMLKTKSSGESMSKQDPPSKAMKMLGLGAGAFGAAQASARGPQPGHEDLGTRRPSLPQWNPAVAAEQRSRPPMSSQRPRGDSDVSYYGQPQTTRPSPPMNTGSRSRTRSNSAASNTRSVSRSGRYREDQDKTMQEGSGATFSPKPSQQFSPQPSPEVYQPLHSDTQNRMRSNSRPSPNGNFQHPSNAVPNGRSLPAGSPSVASSVAMYNSHTGSSPRPPPMASPHSANATSAITTGTTPTTRSPLTPHVPTTRPANLLRKKTVSKAEISEPTLISSTSNVDTVDLPPGASLKNGMDEPPPLPPVNPRRRRTQKLFGFGRDGASDEHVDKLSRPGSPPVVRAVAAFGRVLSPEPGSDSSADGTSTHRQHPRAMRSQESFDTHFSPLIGSPERPVMTEGGMF